MRGSRNRLMLAGLLVLLGAWPATASASRLTVTPAPGTPDASPETQVSILGAAPSLIRLVRVEGSQSGVHSGRLKPYSRRRGASFVLARPLVQGEHVRVLVRVRRRAPLRFSFTVARLGPVPPILNLPLYQPPKLEHFVSEPGLLAPRITTRKRSPGLRGDIFLTPLPSPVVHPGSTNTISISPVGPGGPMILDARGRLVWFKQLAAPDQAANLRVQRYGGRRVLTWWQGPVTSAAFGLGEGVIADRSYRTLRTVHAGNGYKMDIHEFELTPGGDALFTVYSPVLVHLPGTAAGSLSPLLDSIVQEVDVRTGLVVWEWHSLGHIPLNQSYATPANSASYDAFHINSIQRLPRGRVLVSARDTSAVYLIERSSGRILWTLGGKASDFRLRHGARFNFQHHAQMHGRDRLTLFDDEAGPPQKGPYSRAILLKLDARGHRAKLLRQYRRSTDTSAQSEGSVQMLSGGNMFVGFGAEPFFSEFSADGRLVFDASLPQDDGSYRAYRFPWSASPRTRPLAAARLTGAAGVSVYASWNGATAVRRWQVLAGDDAASLAPVRSAPTSGFETRIEVPRSAGMFAVRALGARGRVLGTSAAVTAR